MQAPLVVSQIQDEKGGSVEMNVYSVGDAFFGDNHSFNATLFDEVSLLFL